MTATGLQARWYALHVRPNYEVAVSARLRHLGVEEFLPMQRASRASQRNRFSSRRPLFPGYIFSFIDLGGGLMLYNIPGVLRILGNGGQATPIEDREITMIRSIANSRLPVEPIPYFQSGDRVCLTGGPLAGLSGTFLHTGRDDQLVVSLPLLHRSIAVTVLPDWVMPESTATIQANPVLSRI